MSTDTVYTIGREEAAKRLGVSSRTLDRWIRSGRLKHKSVGRNIYVHAGEFDILLKQHNVRYQRADTFAGQIDQTTGNTAHESTTASHTVDTREEVFRKLYEEAAAEVKAKQEKLEAASFRVGQLEAALKNSVPLIEHKQREEELRQKEELLARENSTLHTQISTERIKLWAVAGVAGVLALFTLVLTFIALR